jgi:DNA-binding beta-propeller fold protein YncE
MWAPNDRDAPEVTVPALHRLLVRIGCATALVSGIAVPLGTAAGSPPVGSLSFTTCISDGGTDGCVAATVSSLAGIDQLTVSPDGKSVYAVGGDASAITWFARSARGGLTDRRCFSATASTGCTTADEPSLLGAEQAAVSPNGKSVYVVSGDAQSLSWFVRSASGALTYKGCLADSTAAGCTALAHVSLNSANSVVVSPDGKNVYVTATDSQAITIFGRNANGALHGEGCLATAGENGCATVNPIGEPTGLAISPSGNSLYVVSSGMLTAFHRAGGGRLTETQCFADASYPGCVTNLDPSLQGAPALTVSPDGKDVYVAAAGSSAVTTYGRAANGTLTAKGCIAPAEAHGCSTPAGFTLDTAHSIAISPDGAHAYVTHNNGVSEFARSSTGTLKYTTCLSYLSTDPCAMPIHNSLHYSYWAALSPDGGDIYIAGNGDGSVSELTRVLAAPRTTITKVNKTARSVTLHFTSSEPGSTFTCKVDKTKFRACTSPHAFTHLKRGRHHFAVEAINSQGTADKTPAKRATKLRK